MEPCPGIDVKLGAPERADHGPALRARDALMSRPPVLGIAGVDAKAIAIDADTSERSEPRRPLRFVLSVGGSARLHHGVLPHGVEQLPRLRVIQPDGGNVVVPKLDTDRVLHFVSEPTTDALVTDLASRDEPVIELMELIAVGRIVQKVREVGKQV